MKKPACYFWWACTDCRLLTKIHQLGPHMMRMGMVHAAFLVVCWMAPAPVHSFVLPGMIHRRLRFIAACFCCPITFVVVPDKTLRYCSASTHPNARGLSMLAAGVAKQSALSKILKKRTGALTVSVEFERNEDSDSTENDLLVLSLRLRQMKAAAVWTSRCSLREVYSWRVAETTEHLSN